MSGPLGQIVSQSSRQPAEAAGAELFALQRQLRAALLDNAAIEAPRARDLAAHMLLHLDDLTACWSIATGWLRSELGCQRVDTGFGHPGDREYFPGFAQSRDANYDVPSFGGSAVDNRDVAMQAMWSDHRPVIFADIKQDSRFTMRLRQRMSGARTKSKFGWSLRRGTNTYGLICADWTEHFAPWESGLYDCFEQTVSQVLSPIIIVAKDFAGRSVTLDSSGRIAPNGSAWPGDTLPTSLTCSEIEVAMLVAQGLSYKEIARMRNRSPATIDHQLRSIRRKLGVSSTSALVSKLARSALASR